MPKKIFCPKCGSTDVKKELNIWSAHEAPTKWICNKCEYYGHLFPEVDEKDIPQLKKEINKMKNARRKK